MPNFTDNKSNGAQTLLVAGAGIEYTDFVVDGGLNGATAGDTIELTAIPRDAVVQGVTILVTEAFAGQTAPTIAISDTSGHEYIAAQDLTSTAVTSVPMTFTAGLPTAIHFEYNKADTLIATLGGTVWEDGTAGRAIVRINYIQKGRSNEVHE